MGTTPAPDYYEILGVTRDATPEEIRTAWRSLTRTAHPDVGGSAGLFRLIMAASEVLLDPARRADYDAGGGGGDDSDPEAWPDESDDGGYFQDDAAAGAYFEDDDAEWQDITAPTRGDPIPTRPVWDGGDTRLRHRPHHLSLVGLAILVTVTVAVLVATLVISDWWLAGVVAADAIGVACICPRRWERVVVAVVAILALAELDTIRVGQYGVRMVPPGAIAAGAIATGATLMVSHRRRHS